MSDAGARARELRAAFDAAFAERAEPPGLMLDLLVVRAGEARVAILQSHVAELHAGLRLTPVPTRCRALLGVANVRGTIVPVYDLGCATREPRWLLVAAGRREALAFDAFERHVRLPGATVPLAVELDGTTVSIADVPAILDRIKEG